MAIFHMLVLSIYSYFVRKYQNVELRVSTVLGWWGTRRYKLLLFLIPIAYGGPCYLQVFKWFCQQFSHIVSVLALLSCEIKVI